MRFLRGPFDALLAAALSCFAVANVLDSELITAHGTFQPGDDVKAPVYQLPTGTRLTDALTSKHVG